MLSFSGKKLLNDLIKSEGGVAFYRNVEVVIHSTISNVNLKIPALLRGGSTYLESSSSCNNLE